MQKKLFLPTIILLLLISIIAISCVRESSSRLPKILYAEGSVLSYAVYTEDGNILYANKIEEIKRSLGGNVSVRTDLYTVNNPIGIIENPPFESIVNIYNKVLKSIDKSRKILIIYIDGLGYEQYKNAADSGSLPYIASVKPAAEALTVYPPITDVAFAAMVTGNTPKYTGIHSREKKPLPIPTIFDIAAEKGKSSKVIEGNIKIIADEVPTVLNIDDNKNDTIDDEIYACAMAEIKDPPDVLLVHFHSYDDFGHKYGPASEKAINQLSVLDSYIENIIKEYEGDVIITSDHGMHDVQDGGAHGEFLSSDLYIPIIEINQADKAGDL